MQSFWFIIGLVALTIAALRAVLARRRQNRLLRGLARSRRLNFTPEDLIGVHERFCNLRLIRRGHRRHAWNLLYGTTDAGLISLFCYRYDLGFGIQQSHRQCWIAVLETPRNHARWYALLAASEPQADSRPTAQLAGFTIHADGGDTINRLCDAGLEAVLRNAAPADRLETNHQLVAAAAPYSRDIETPARLLDTTIQLARLTLQRKVVE